MFTSRQSQATGWRHSGGLWLVLLLLSAVVIAPTLCLLWFMAEAMNNERLAVRQKLVQFYEQQLSDAGAAVNRHWAALAENLATDSAERPAGERFEALAGAGGAESVVLYGTNGAPAYPLPLVNGLADDEIPPPPWLNAEFLEHSKAQFAEAAAIYGDLAGAATNPNFAARALRARMRTLFKAGLEAEALSTLHELEGETYRKARDPYGRLILPDAQLLALQSCRDSQAREAILGSLTAMLEHREGDDMPVSQRVFTRERLMQLNPGLQFAALRAEALADEYLALAPPSPPGGEFSAVGGLWRLPSADGRAVALFGSERLVAVMNGIVMKNMPATGVEAGLALASEPAKRDPFLKIPPGGYLPGWELRLYLSGENPFAQAAERQIALYLWTGGLVVVMAGLVALFMGRHLVRQMRLTRLKNDFVATVSHELKTPLASMRLLVDTLLDRPVENPKQTREYLELIARENQRLSRLIDNFLSFSRMERNKRSFDFTETDPADVARAAVAAAGDRLKSANCDFQSEIAPGLPPIYADLDALATVLVNLLDNAYKYTGDHKRIVLRVKAEAGVVAFQVEDNGIGLSRKDAARIFDRFYQADQSLTRKVGGCGLGLSIVKFIVEAHGGRIEVASQPGQGTCFTVRISAMDADGRANGGEQA